MLSVLMKVSVPMKAVLSVLMKDGGRVECADEARVDRTHPGKHSVQTIFGNENYYTNA